MYAQAKDDAQSASHSACGGQRTSPTPCEYTCATSFSLPGASYPLALGTRTRAARTTEESARPRGRSCGGCARSDDHAPEKTAAKRKAYGEQTGRGRSDFARRRPYHWPTKPRSDLEFRILGPLEVIRAQRPLPIGSPRQRALLGLLLLHANEPITRERLIEELWPDGPPQTVSAVLNVYLSRLRRLLVGGKGEQPLLTEAAGYVLHVPPEGLDARRFETLLETGRQELACGETARASVTLRDALALWRGPALADLAFEPFAQSEIARLEELRLTAIESRIESDLAVGRQDALVAELETLVAAHPYREGLRVQLMLALYRSGRQAEALETYRSARRTFSEGTRPRVRGRDEERRPLAAAGAGRARCRVPR